MRKYSEWSRIRWVKFALLVLGLAAWMVFLRPAPLGGPLSLVMVSGQSMEPTMETGDLAVVYQRSHYEAGDVVAFQPESEATGSSSSMVIHRIVDGTADQGFVTQGDGNDWLDPWETPPEGVAGEMVFFIPGAGHGMARLMDPITLAALFAAGTAFLVLSGPERSKEPSGTDAGDTAWAAGASP